MTYLTYTCPNCNGVGGCHNYPCQGMFPPAPQWPLYPPPTPGATPVKQLTEDDVRRIVQEELAKRGDPMTLRTIGGKP